MVCLVTLRVSRPVNRLSGQARPGQKNRPMKGHRPSSGLQFFCRPDSGLSKSDLAWPIPNLSGELFDQAHMQRSYKI
ncbi:hypothetical protein MTR_2g040720 [Medicago truncatula]|uniref:Uncharacterized protein n=1 Tax=Medicago truncatula TaxID=3880 RepID=A0A072V7A3_MEDTR|nr:hypothetical protein MTR_2g040720 [Medicago truncatula]